MRTPHLLTPQLIKYEIAASFAENGLGRPDAVYRALTVDIMEDEITIQIKLLGGIVRFSLPPDWKEWALDAINQQYIAPSAYAMRAELDPTWH